MARPMGSVIGRRKQKGEVWCFSRLRCLPGLMVVYR